MNLASTFKASAEQRPQKPALFWGDKEFSYGELWSQSIHVAARLQKDSGVAAGDRIGLWLKNCPEFVPSLFGALLAGGVVVPINNFLKPDEVNYILQDAGIDVLVTDSELATHSLVLAAARPQLRLLKVEDFISSYSASSANRKLKIANCKFPARSEPDLAVIIYTSGTTGRPKGAMLSHGNLLHNVNSCRIVLETVEGDRFAVLLPMFHSYMLTVGVLLPLLAGGSIVLVKSLHPLKNVIHEICQRQASILPGFPQFYRSLVSAPIPGPVPLRVCISGAAPLPVQVLKDFEAKFGIPLIEGYGLSEASPVVTKNPIHGPRKAGSIGIPIHDVEVSVQDDEGRILPPREIGEICVRGGNVMQGYWNQPEETAKAFRNGWLLTGDVGYRDEDGYFYITDRKKDMLLVNGLNVYPREIEEVIYQFPQVKEAAVIGIPDPRRGEQPVAYVVPNEGSEIDGDALIQFLRAKLADYKVPRIVNFMPSLPRNPTGKILKTALRDAALSKK